MKIKVCGMKYPDNIQAVLNLNIDWMGFIFYPPSPRYFNGDLSGIDFKQTQKTGVFVDEDVDVLLQKARYYQLDYIQLHGNESLHYAQRVKDNGYKLIKVFKIHPNFDFSFCYAYTDVADLFLFDTKGKLPGGNAQVFDWQILNRYQTGKDFLLSGGISPTLSREVQKFSHKNYIGIDVNSGFEEKPGWKNVEKLQKFIQTVQTRNQK